MCIGIRPEFCPRGGVMYLGNTQVLFRSYSTVSKEEPFLEEQIHRFRIKEVALVHRILNNVTPSRRRRGRALHNAVKPPGHVRRRSETTGIDIMDNSSATVSTGTHTALGAEKSVNEDADDGALH